MNAVPIDSPSVLHLSPYLAGQAVEISALAWEARRHAQALAVVLERCASRPGAELTAQSEMAHAERRLADVVGILRTARERFETLPVSDAGVGE